jgi:hypothetical protein
MVLLLQGYNYSVMESFRSRLRVTLAVAIDTVRRRR